MKNTIHNQDWNYSGERVRSLEDGQLLKEYHHSLKLSAKSPKELKLEVLLEDEVQRRSLF